ncbi:GNAT family N-acetyltransferase [Nonomuraea sp. WAC 01424]|uniref:GNAT family N-acetyltransferase n=1 Tax=Nonomuraea sp. WAC 01424 TaxID=2203200 RepID=UPI000F782201|nr:GNAT family N-acetyltransferase [Nonomuraea sp. WAC 01424]RSN05584.1 GNAT family N-acetyltransferase [Nonomuraea sp. WAC 01424]
METLADLLSDAAAGRPPAPDCSVTVLPQPSERDAGIIAFTAHTVVFADVDPAWVHARLPAGDLSAPLLPAFLTAMEAATGRRAGNLDLLALAAPLPGPPPLPLEELTGGDHPRVARARRYRDAVRVWVTGDEAGLVTLGQGVGGRWEVAVEVEPGHRGRGLGRALATAARHLAPGPLWAQIAPGNAASVRAFLAAGYLPMGAESLLVLDDD